MAPERRGFRRLAGPGALGDTECCLEVVESAFPLTEVLASWEAYCPPPARLRIEVRARIEGRWSPWYCLGLWSEEDRTSVPGQEDGVARVATDALVLKRPAAAIQARILVQGAMKGPPPSLRALSLAWSGPSAAWGTVLAVPAYSQMTYAAGKGWCSPTCLAMALAYWEGALDESEEAIEKRITRTAAAVHDPAFGGCGNWAFNTAYAGSLGYRAELRRFASLADLEDWTLGGVPPILSVSWDSASRPLSGAPLPSSAGHLLLLAGFDPEGRPVVNDPAAPDRSSVRRTYPRAELEARWLEASSGTAYLVRPQGHGL